MSKRLILIGWEAADWKILHPLIDSGKMPALQQIVENGASGSMLCGRPLLPAPQWTSLMTGKRAWQHGVSHQVEFDAATGRPVPIPAAHRKTAALWEILARDGRKPLVVGWPATHGARCENAVIVSNRYAEPTAAPGIKPWPPAAPGTYCPESFGASLDRLRVSPEEIQGDLLSQYVPDWKKIDQKRDRRLGHLRVFLAADLSHHAAMMHLLRQNDWQFAAVQFPALGAISALFLPFIAPRREWISEVEFHLYSQVLNAACVMLDRMLHSLIQAAGKDAAVIVASAHGVNQNLSPQYLRGRDNDSWKSSHGILAACGPGFSRDSLILGATIQDVTPTILTWFGLPLGDDMEGRILLESFDPTPEVRRIPSWGAMDGTLSPKTGLPSGPLPDNPAAVQLQQESEWNLAMSFLDGARFDESLRLLEKLFRSFPERADFGLALFHCQLTLKKTEEASAVLEVLLETIPPGVWSLLARVELLIAQGKRKEALQLVGEIQALRPADPEALRRLGMVLWRLREWSGLARLSREALQRNENEPLAWLGLAESTLHLREPDQAVAAATRAIGLNFFMPQAHEVLFRARLMQGKWAEAREAMNTLRRMQPDNRTVAAYARRGGPDENPASSE